MHASVLLGPHPTPSVSAHGLSGGFHELTQAKGLGQGQGHVSTLFAFRVIIITTVFSWRIYSSLITTPLPAGFLGRPAQGPYLPEREWERRGSQGQSRGEETYGEAPGNASCLGSHGVSRARLTVCRTLHGTHLSDRELLKGGHLAGAQRMDS